MKTIFYFAGLILTLSLSVQADVSYSFKEHKPASHEQLKTIVIKEKLVSKKVIDDCKQVKKDEICTLKLKEVLTMPNITNIRIIKHDMPVTMDFSPNRVNVLLNKEEEITDIRIG